MPDVRRWTPDHVEEHTLSDGTFVTLRFIRPEDAEGLRAAFARLSPTSRYRRFFSGLAELSPHALAYLTKVDGEDHVAIVAIAASPDLKEELGLGVARFIRVAGEPEVAEAAVTVVDDAQQKGLGRLLGLALIRAARERGVFRFRAEVLPSNAPVRAMLDEVGAVVSREEPDSLVFDIPLPDLDEERDEARFEASIRRVLRAIASQLVGLIRSLRPPE